MNKPTTIVIDGKPFDVPNQERITVKEAIKEIRKQIENKRKKVFQVVLDGELLTYENSSKIFPLPLNSFHNIQISTIDPYPIALDSISYLSEKTHQVEIQLQKLKTNLENNSTIDEPDILLSIGKTMVTIHNELEDIRSLIGWDFGLMVIHLEPILDHCQKWQEIAEIFMLSEPSELLQYREFITETVLPQLAVWNDIFSSLEHLIFDTLQKHT
ncbi:MAG: hypothetical protein N2450_01405 [bacterium]|nr:hypothetical protein [bacterium]